MSSEAEINQDDMRKSAIELERLLDKYRNQPKYVDGKPTWSEDIQQVYDKIIKYINMAKNGEINEPLDKNFRPISYFIDETPVDYTYPDLSHAYSTFILDIQGWKRGKAGQEVESIIQAARERALKIRKERGLD